MMSSPDKTVFPFSQIDFHENIHENVQKISKLDSAAFIISSHSLCLGGATRDYMLKIFSLLE